MKFYKFWARGEAMLQDSKRPWKVCAYGGSDNSMEEATRRADERAKQLIAAIECGSAGNEYGYSDRPVREEIVQEYRDGTELSSAITRNSYGSLVLNTSRVMFVDVDVPSAVTLGSFTRSIWDKLRGKSTPPQADGDLQLQRIEAVGRERPGLGYRVYRTAGGYRVLITSDLYDPMSPESEKLLAAFGSDPLYTRLCKAQECFRARLSAKFWRCGARRPPSRFPWATADQEQQYRKWEEAYHRRANRFATCQLIGTFGPPEVCEAVRPILEMHDNLTMQAGARLA